MNAEQRKANYHNWKGNKSARMCFTWNGREVVDEGDFRAIEAFHVERARLIRYLRSEPGIRELPIRHRPVKIFPA